MQPKKETIDAMIHLEWQMFHSVNEGAELAWCQNEPETFDGMRRGQYESWDAATCESYLRDLQEAAEAGRNLAEEKYIYMMRSTAPAEFLLLMDRVPPIDCETETLAAEITRRLMEQTAALRKQFPLVSGTGRPLRATEDTPQVTSVETYQKSELYTYSLKTLRALRDHLAELEAQGISLARLLQENSLKTYGFTSLEQAEAYLREKRAQRQELN